MTGERIYMTDYAKKIASEMGLETWQVAKVIELIDEGNTIPFIARYRKEAHGSLDDQKIRELSEKLESSRALDARRNEVRILIEDSGCDGRRDSFAALDQALTISR